MLNDDPPKPCEKSVMGGIGEWNALIECECLVSVGPHRRNEFSVARKCNNAGIG
jgi:hypothetical protein